MPDARAAMPTMPRSRAAWFVSTPVPSTRSVNEPESISSVISLSNSLLERQQVPAQRPRRLRRRSHLTPPNAIVPRKQARAEEPLVQTDQPLALRLRAAGRDRERHVGRERADIGDVVVEALQLEQHDPQRRRARRHLDAGQPLDRVAVGERVTDRRVAGNRLGEEQPVSPRQPLEALLDSLVNVEEPELQIQHRLAGHAKPEVSGLDDARVHRADRHLEHAFAGHRPERMPVTGHAGHGRVVRESPCATPTRRRASRREARRVPDWGGPPAIRPKKSITSRSNQFAAGCRAAIDGNDGVSGETGAETRRNVRRAGSDQT